VPLIGVNWLANQAIGFGLLHIAFAGLLFLQTAAMAVGLAVPRAVRWKDSAAA
jgi:hypothetical protein